MNSTTLRGQFSKNLDQIIRNTGFDSNIIYAMHHHLEVLHEYHNYEDKINYLKNIKRVQYCNLLLSKLFFDRLELYPSKNFTCQIDEKSNWPVPVIPTEVFGGPKLDEESRRKRFFKCLKVSDILECRVIVALSEDYLLRVIHKYGITRMLDDLSIKVRLPRNDAEFSILQKELLLCELIRVAVKDIKNENEILISVTVDAKSVLFAKKPPKLGLISDEELPSYVISHPDPEKNSSYSEYLNGMTMFRNTASLPDFYIGFGIDPYSSHSYYPVHNHESCPDDKSAQTLLRESKLYDARNYTNSAISALRNENINEAFNWIKKAIQICPEKGPLLSKMYEIRSDIHTAVSGPNKISKSSCLDLELAITTDPNNEAAKTKYADFLYKSANCYYQKRMYREAAAALEGVTKLDSGHSYGILLLEHIKFKHKEVLVNLDEVSLPELEEKKKELASKLQKIH